MELNLSLLWVIAFVLVLTFVVNRLLLKPLTETMLKRQHAIDSARALADRAAADARSATDEFERKTAAARAEVYRQMDDMRRVANDERAKLLEETRADAAAALGEATAKLQADTAKARAELRGDAEKLGNEAAGRILGKQAS
ncbi:MAG: ATP synthase F0 subunit B [Acidobacteriota bacterium]|nr:ATP synthase F0 subunit B [Acidobacteriota bacterium]